MSVEYILGSWSTFTHLWNSKVDYQLFNFAEEQPVARFLTTEGMREFWEIWK